MARSSSNSKLKILVLELIKFNQEQIQGQIQVKKRLIDLISLIDSTLTNEEAQSVASSILNSPKSCPYSKNIILCLTLRKIITSKREQLKKFSFFMIRSILAQTKKNSLKAGFIKGKKYKKFIMRRKKLKLETRLQQKTLKILSKFLKTWKFQAQDQNFKLNSISTMTSGLSKLVKVKVFQSIKSLFLMSKLKQDLLLLFTSVKSAFFNQVYLQKLSTFHQLKVIFLKSRQKKSFFPLQKALKVLNRSILQISFNLWYDHLFTFLYMKPSKTLKSTKRKVSYENLSFRSISPQHSTTSSRRYASEAVNILPLPSSIHDYIDDMLEASRRDQESYYYSLSKNFL